MGGGYTLENMEYITNVTYGTSTFVGGLKLIPTFLLSLAREGDKDAIREIEEIEKYNLKIESQQSI